MYVRIGAKIKKAREENLLSQAELGAKLGVTATAVNYYEKGKRKISIDDLYRLAAALKKPVDFFLSDGPEPSKKKKKSPRCSTEIFHDMIKIPVVGQIKAGEPETAEQNVVGYLPFPKQFIVEPDFALMIKGDSMEGIGISDGDLVLIRRQSYVDYNGQVICAIVSGQESTLKIYRKEKDGRVFLRAANPVYPDMVINDEKDLLVQGVYAGVFKFPSKKEL